MAMVCTSLISSIWALWSSYALYSSCQAALSGTVASLASPASCRSCPLPERPSSIFVTPWRNWELQERMPREWRHSLKCGRRRAGQYDAPHKSPLDSWSNPWSLYNQ